MISNLKSKDIIQLKLFQTTKQLNLSETYETIPKEIAPNDPNIKWESDNIALPLEKPFKLGDKDFIVEITPATMKERKTWIYKTKFPYTREARIEYALISLATKESINFDKDKQSNKIFVIKTTYYQIQKEIIEAINKTDYSNLKPNDCPYNITSIKEALEVLKKTNIKVTDLNWTWVYNFNRIKDIYFNDKKVIIELNTMVANYISNWDYLVTNKNRLLSSKNYYPLKIRSLLQLKFRYAGKWETYNISFNSLIERISYIEKERKSKSIFKIKNILNSMPEVKKVEVKNLLEGRKIIDATVIIHPSDSFIQEIIESNKKTKRVQEPIIDNWELLIEPLESDFLSSSEFEKAKTDFRMKKTKSFLKRKSK